MISPASWRPRRALVIKLGHIGDVLVATPVFTALREAFPQLRLHALVNQGTQAMLAHNPIIEKVLVLRRQHDGKRAALAHQLGLVRAVALGGYDLCLELSGGDRGAFYCLASRARARLGFAAKRPCLRDRVFYLAVDRSGVDEHMASVNLRPLRAWGLDPHDTGLKLYPGPSAQEQAGRLMAQHGFGSRGFVLVHPTSRWMFKTWTMEGNREVIAHLASQGLPVALTCAPVPVEMDYLARLAGSLDPAWPVVNLAGALDLPTLGALLAQARLMVGVDSAPMHMAAALGTPVLALFGPSGEKMWGPWQVDHRVVAGDCPERPCGADGCQGGKVSRCLEELPAARVIAALDELLALKGEA